LSRGDGRILQPMGSPVAILIRTRTLFLKGFCDISPCNKMRGRLPLGLVNYKKAPPNSGTSEGTKISFRYTSKFLYNASRYPLAVGKSKFPYLLGISRPVDGDCSVILGKKQVHSRVRPLPKESPRDNLTLGWTWTTSCALLLGEYPPGQKNKPSTVCPNAHVLAKPVLPIATLKSTRGGKTSG